MTKGIKRIFSEVSNNYELINHILTLGLDILWRKKAAKEAVKVGGLLWLDICTGTGEMAQNLSRLAEKRVRIVAADFCFPMLAKAMKKDIQKVLFTATEAKSLPFPDQTFDLVTISFATRNINTLREMLINHLREFRRVLKPGGHFVHLETSQPSVKILKRLFHFYVKLVVKPVGYCLSGSKAGYTYLSYTLPRFYPPEEFSLILSQVGFRRITFRSLLFGASAIHIAIKK